MESGGGGQEVDSSTGVVQAGSIHNSVIYQRIDTVQLPAEAAGEILCNGGYKAAFIALLTSLLCSIIPFFILSTIGAVGSIIAAVLWLRKLRREGLNMANKIKTILAILVVASLLSGCSPLFFDEPSSSMLDICGDTGQCKTFDVVGYSVLGIPIQKASVNQARMLSNIREVRGIQVKTGYGLISVTKVRIYGS